MTELETIRRAKMYLDLLAQGIDPISGQEVPEDGVLNQVRLARCFFYVSGILQQVIDNGGTVGTKPKKAKFVLTPQLLARLTPAERDLRITEFAELVGAAVDDPEMGRPSTTAMTNWLVDKGFLVKETGADGKTHRLPTEAGLQLGIFTRIRQGQYGEYLAVYYTPQAQQFLIDHLKQMLEDRQG